MNIALVGILALGLCGNLDLASRPFHWQVNIDRPGLQMTMLNTAEANLAVTIQTNGGSEDFPKLRLGFPAPQDWRQYTRLDSRLRITCDDKSVVQKNIAFVFYDEKTRLVGYPGEPMKQQVVAHQVPVGKWVEFKDWLAVNRSAIRQFDIYLYELPPAQPHTFTVEIASLTLQEAGPGAVMDGEAFPAEQLRANAGPPAAKLVTDDGLELEIGRNGGVYRVRVNGRLAGRAGRLPTGLLVRDVAAGGPPVQVGGSIARRDNAVLQSATLPDMGLAVNATYRSRGKYLEIAGKVADLRGEDRAITVYFALPLRAGSWQWWDSVSRSRTASQVAGELFNLEVSRGYGLHGAHSKYPLGTVTVADTAGLTLAVRMDEPVVHRIIYNPSLDLFFIALDFGLVPGKTVRGRPLSQAPFRVLLYATDPAWGLRSALERYYQFFPRFFTKRVRQEGGWYVWGNMAETEGALQAGFAFHWGPQDPEAVKWDNEHGVVALNYIEPEFLQQTMSDFQSAPTVTDAIERLQKLAAGDPAELAKMAKLPYAKGGSGHVPYLSMELITRQHDLSWYTQGIARATLISANRGPDNQLYCDVGKRPWMSKSQWGAMFYCNLDPDIPQGKGRFNLDVVLKYALQSWRKNGARIDGIALDSLGGYGQTSRVNYCREHFRYADIPLSFSAITHEPVQVAAFATVEWLRELARRMHGQGMLLMANCSWGSTPGWLTFAAPYLDIFGAEAPQFADPDFIRAIARHKPCTDLPYRPRPDWEVAWHLLHDIYPGHGNKVEVMARYAALLREMSRAGWEPVTWASVQPQGLRIERYGNGDRIYFAVHNPTTQPQDVTVQVDAQALGLQSARATLLPEGRALLYREGSLRLSLPAHGTGVVLLQRAR